MSGEHLAASYHCQRGKWFQKATPDARGVEMIRRDPLGFVGAMEALAGRESTHQVVRCDTGKVIFRGTESQCFYVKEGFDIDLREGHPDAMGETVVLRIGEGSP